VTKAGGYGRLQIKMNDRPKPGSCKHTAKVRKWVVVARGISDDAVIGPGCSALVEQRPIGKSDKKLTVFLILA
jgi:hypothetical protein